MKLLPLTLIVLTLAACNPKDRGETQFTVLEISSNKTKVISGSNGTGAAIAGGLIAGTAGAVVGSTMRSPVKYEEKCSVRLKGEHGTYISDASDICSSLRKGDVLACQMVGPISGPYCRGLGFRMFKVSN